MSAKHAPGPRLLALLIAMAASSSLPCIPAEPKVRPVFDLNCSTRLRTGDGDGRSTPIPYNCQIDDDLDPFSWTSRPTPRTPRDVHQVPRTTMFWEDSPTRPEVLDHLLLLWRSIRLEEQNRSRR